MDKIQSYFLLPQIGSFDTTTKSRITTNHSVTDTTIEEGNDGIVELSKKHFKYGKNLYQSNYTPRFLLIQKHLNVFNLNIM